MPWPRALQLVAAAERRWRSRLADLSCAARAAQADEKGWARWLKMMARE